MTESDFNAFFKRAAGFDPYEWQRQVALNGLPEILSVPTGFGKTEGAVLAWAWRRTVQDDRDEPLHLVYCLPRPTISLDTLLR